MALRSKILLINLYLLGHPNIRVQNSPFRKTWTIPRVEAGENTSTVVPASRKGRQKGNSLRWDGKVWLLGINNLTSEWLHCKLQTRFLVREGAFERRLNCQTKEEEQTKIWSRVPKGGPISRRTGRLTVDRKNSNSKMNDRILHPCKRRSQVSWLLKLFESHAPMRTLPSKILPIHANHIVHPNTLIQSRLLRRQFSCMNDFTAPVYTA
jgi:hypothetical protein